MPLSLILVILYLGGSVALTVFFRSHRRHPSRRGSSVDSAGSFGGDFSGSGDSDCGDSGGDSGCGGD